MFGINVLIFGRRLYFLCFEVWIECRFGCKEIVGFYDVWKFFFVYFNVYLVCNFFFGEWTVVSEWLDIVCKICFYVLFFSYI